MEQGTGKTETEKETLGKNRDSNMKQKNEKNNLKEIKEYWYYEIWIFDDYFSFRL
jgi:hypothetical protein